MRTERERERAHTTRWIGSIDPSMGTSIGNTPLPIASWLVSLVRVRRTKERTKESKGGERTEGGRESPEGPLVAQLSHLPIGPSHVLICLLVNPRRPPVPLYRLFRSRLSWNPCACLSLLVPLSPVLVETFSLFSPRFRSLSSLGPFLSLSFFLPERNHTANRSKMNSTADRRAELPIGTA